MIGSLLFFGYLLLGAHIALRYDAKEMRQHVPYGDAPAICSIRTIRFVSVCTLTFVGPVLFSMAFVDSVRYRFRVVARARRRFR